MFSAPSIPSPERRDGPPSIYFLKSGVSLLIFQTARSNGSLGSSEGRNIVSEVVVVVVVPEIVPGIVGGRLAQDVTTTARRTKTKELKCFIIYFSSNAAAFFMFAIIGTEKGQRSSQLPQAEQSDARRSRER